MLVNAKDVLAKAKKERYAVGSFNVTTLEMIRGIIQAAENENSPVILQFAEGHNAYVPLDILGPIMIREAERAKVPVIVHFDHGESFGQIVQAMKMGFTSVMIDASHLPFEQNVQAVKEIIKIAHSLDISVEAELGTLNRESGILTEDCVEYDKLANTFTDPNSAADFIAQTNADMLAVAFGTVHGVYTQEPNLDFARLSQINALSDVPLVMHGV